MKAQVIDLTQQTMTWHWHVLANLEEVKQGADPRYTEIDSSPSARGEVEALLENLYPNQWEVNHEMQYRPKSYCGYALAFKFYRVTPEISVELTEEMIHSNLMRYQ